MKSQESRFIPAPPLSPGDVLRTRILSGTGITQEGLATAMRVSRISVNQIINGRRAVTAEMAMRLSRVTSTTPEFWLNLQRDVDLYDAGIKLAKEIDQLDVLRSPKTDAELFEFVD